MCIFREAISSPAAILALALFAVTAAFSAAHAGSLTQKDVLILGKALGFLEPPPTGTATVAIAYDPADPSSKQNAETIAGYFGDGLKAGGAVLKPKLMETGQLSGGGFVAVVAASGVKLDQLAGVTQALHVACITADANAVQAGQCVMSVKSDPKVEILINHSAASRSGVNFGSAFLLMAHEV